MTGEDPKERKAMELNCGFQIENKCFRYRAAAIIVEDGCVLIHIMRQYNNAPLHGKEEQ